MRNGMWFGLVFALSGLTLRVGAGCTPCEGPIVVSTDEEPATTSWAEAGSDDFQSCRPGLSDHLYECGPDRNDAEGTFVIRLEWEDGTVEDREVTIENDQSCVANADEYFPRNGDTDTAS